MNSRTARLALLAAAALIAAPSFASAIELTPGAWQDTETGTENGKPVPPKTETSCMSPAEAKDPLKGFAPDKDMKGQCKTIDVKQSAAGIFMHLVCGDPKQFSMDIAVDYAFNSPRSYTGTIKSAVTMMGKTTTTDKKVEGKWMAAACSKTK
jgi:hypothetical protein